MANTLKRQLASRIIELVRKQRRDPTLDRAKCETALRSMGMKAGNAQRLLDESTDVQLSRLLEASTLLKVPPAALLDFGAEAPGAEPPISAAASEITVLQAAEPAPLGLLGKGTPLEAALPVVVDAIARAPAARWASVRAQLEQIVQRPDMRDEVLDELMTLLQGSPGKQRTAA